MFLYAIEVISMTQTVLEDFSIRDNTPERFLVSFNVEFMEKGEISDEHK
jgi:hypothetical protein